MRMLRLDGSFKKTLSEQLESSAKNHFVDYTIHASIFDKYHVDELNFLYENGISSFKIYMNLGLQLNRIHMDLSPGEYNLRDGEVNMEYDTVYSLIKKGSERDGVILVHAEDINICSSNIGQLTELKKNHQQKTVLHSNIHKDTDSEKGNFNNDSDNSHNNYSEPLKILIKEDTFRHLDENTFNENPLQLWSDCRPPYSESRCIEKISQTARDFGANIYYVHIGSSDALDAIIREREKGKCNLFIETCPQYLTHDFSFNNLRGKVVPPLRSKFDVQSIWYALRNGMIDTVGTDHVANRLELKLGGENHDDLLKSLSGFPGMATMLPVLLSQGVNKKRIDLLRVSELCSYNTSRIFNMYPRKGTIAEGSDADLTIIDLDLEKNVTPELLQSYSDYTIYDGWNMKGWPIMTIVRGKIVMENGYVEESLLGHGKFVSR
ncbi:MAG: hypothetical protein DA328_07610 [Nitrososphaeraceae archaeon]|nr:hypothetical protein [Nitrososphaeraceae archaeon]